MQLDVEGQEEFSSRHPLAALPFSAILRFTGGRRRRGPRDGDAATTAEAAPAVADRRGLYTLLAAEGVSQVGNTITIVAGPWFVLETTGSAARIGIVSAALASAATIAAVPLLYHAGILQFWHLVVLVFVLASINSNGDTARFGLVPFLAGRARMPIERPTAPTGRSSAWARSSGRSWAGS